MTHATVFLALGSILGASEPAPKFIAARPVWLQGRETEMNLSVGFRAVMEAPSEAKTLLRLTGSSIYRVTVNGEFVAHGPARGPHDWFRVDEIDISGRLKNGPNVVAVEVAGYNIPAYNVANRPAFLQAEIIAGDKVSAATGSADAPFEATLLDYRVQKAERYSHQRQHSEVYRLQPGFDAWAKDPQAKVKAAALAVLEPRELLPRRVMYPEYQLRKPVRHIAAGSLKRVPDADVKKSHDVAKWGLAKGGFPIEQFEVFPTVDLQRTAAAEVTKIDPSLADGAVLRLKGDAFHVLDLGTNLTGFIGFHVNVKEKVRLYAAFDEILTKGDVDFLRLMCANVVYYELAPGTYDVESIEPYTLRGLKLVSLDGDCEVSAVRLREYVNPDVKKCHFACSDPRLNTIFAAARETFRQNALDIFMDCPSRERAGWLCDSFFTSRVALDLSGNTLVEKNFLENFLLPKRFENLPDGMLPMCYPSDHSKNSFIPNWAMWFVLQLEEYAARTGDRAMVDALKPKVENLLKYFEKFRNSDGLLEKLESWVFVEWSDANHYVQDVNYPSNMLYARMLEAAGRMYGNQEWIGQAGRIRETVRKQSFDGEFFVDNAVRKNGKLEITKNRTETCQYYAFFLGTAGAEEHGKLLRTLTEQFGPRRKETKAFPSVSPSNQFIGNVLRLEILSKQGLAQQIVEDVIGYNLYMAEQTGTLWENNGAEASCNHGFASHTAHLLYRDVLGIHRCDTVNKAVTIRLPDVKLDWCEGRMPTPHGVIELHWEKQGDKLAYKLKTPDGYKVEVENASNRELVAK